MPDLESDRVHAIGERFVAGTGQAAEDERADAGAKGEAVGGVDRDDAVLDGVGVAELKLGARDNGGGAGVGVGRLEENRAEAGVDRVADGQRAGRAAGIGDGPRWKYRCR